MLLVSLVAHFWQIGFPNVVIYDEHIYVDKALRYMRGQPFFEVHPPLAILSMALSMWLFGCHSWSWRLPSALFGTALIPCTYLLARRMFRSRAAAALTTLLLLGDGLFLQYSRLALINIVYVSLGAASYLMLFRYLQGRESIGRRRSLAWMGVFLGLGLGAKLAIPAIAWILAVGFVLASLILESLTKEWRDRAASFRNLRYAISAVALIGGISGLFFLLTFLPNYALGWWSGVSSLTNYYHQVVQANLNYPNPENHQDSPWWSWPLLLRPYRIWQQLDDLGRYLALWGGGNPAVWWGALVAIVLAGVRALRGGGVVWSFLAIGYLLYTAMWIPVPRALYLYSYLPAYYLGVLALGGLLAACWRGRAELWEQVSIMLPVFAVSFLGFGVTLGTIASILVLGGFVALVRLRADWAGKFVCGIFVITTLAVFVYFLPLWIPLPLSKEGVDARMWLNNVGLGDWK